MKNESSYTKKLSAFLKKHKAAAPASSGMPLDPVVCLTRGFLQWQSTSKLAANAHERILSQLVDHNDLRVSHNHEVVELLGRDYPQAEERAARLHESLQDIFVREHSMMLDDLANKSKKDVRDYFETLSGITPYVVRYTLLHAYQHAVVPVDFRMVELLIAEELLPDQASDEEASQLIEKLIESEDAMRIHLGLQTWADGKPLAMKKAPAPVVKKSDTKTAKVEVKPAPKSVEKKPAAAASKASAKSPVKAQAKTATSNPLKSASKSTAKGDAKKSVKKRK